MCGIHGILFPNGEIGESLRAMHAALAHRGPDGDGLLSLPDGAFGHRRLSIIDLSDGGAQPMWSTDHNVCITYNGEIYNYRELRDECIAAGRSFRSDSDTEVILESFLMRGPSSFGRLNGMFAFCLYDARDRSFWLVRDRIGIKPLYYAQTPSGVVFASELGALLASGLVPRKVDPAALRAFLQLDYVPSPMSMIEGVRKLPGGTVLQVRSGGFKPFPLEQDAIIPEHGGDPVTQFGNTIQSVVQRQLIADVPVGVFLSGGLDSSIVALTAASLQSEPLQTFSIAFEDPDFDERSHFELVARTIGSKQKTTVVTAREALNLIPTLPSIATEPIADGSLIPTTILSRFARNDVKVVLSGDGADELFAGYPTHYASPFGRIASLAPPWLRQRALGAAHKYMRVVPANFSREFKVKKFLEGVHLDPITQNAQWLGTFLPEEFSELLAPAMQQNARDLDSALDQLLHSPSNDKHGLEALLRTDRRFYLQDQVLVKADRASMRHALEVRVPFLDNQMLAFADALPSKWKLHGRISKVILRRFIHSHLPASIRDRPKKGFGVPLARWFRGDLRPLLRETLSESRLLRDGFFEPTYVQRLIQEHESGARDHRKRLFNLLTFTMWYESIRRIDAA